MTSAASTAPPAVRYMMISMPRPILSYACFARSEAGAPCIKTTVTFAPSAANKRAATKPSPPLLPLPHKMTVFLPVTSIFSVTAAATAAPAFSISVSMETPDSTVHDSSPLISAAVNTRIYLPLFRSILCFNGIIFPCGFQLWKRRKLKSFSRRMEKRPVTEKSPITGRFTFLNLVSAEDFKL